MPYTDYYGYYQGDIYKGYMPDGRLLICETEREYHYLFDEELAEFEAFSFSQKFHVHM